MAGKIQVDTDSLPNVIAQFQAIHDAIDAQKTNITSAYNNLTEAVSGTASAISTFENNASTALTNLNNLDTTLATWISDLNQVLIDATNAITALS